MTFPKQSYGHHDGRAEGAHGRWDVPQHPSTGRTGGRATTVATTASMATTRQQSGRWASLKVGDQVEWAAELKGLTTIDERLLNAIAMETLN